METDMEEVKTKDTASPAGPAPAKGSGRGKRKQPRNPIKLRPCEVCGTKASGIHFGAITCEACKMDTTTSNEGCQPVAKTVTKTTRNKKGNNPINLRPCEVCGAKASGFHFGAITCEACKSFFRRTMVRNLQYSCFSGGGATSKCPIRLTKGGASPCPACRMDKCLELNMSLTASKKGRYTHEKRAETIDASKSYWSNQVQGSSSQDSLPVQGQQGHIASQQGQMSSPEGQIGLPQDYMYSPQAQLASPLGQITSPQSTSALQHSSMLGSPLVPSPLSPNVYSEALMSSSDSDPYSPRYTSGQDLEILMNTREPPGAVNTPQTPGGANMQQTLPTQQTTSQDLQAAGCSTSCFSENVQQNVMKMEPAESMTSFLLHDDVMGFPTQDVDDLSRALSEEQKDEEELKKIIDETIAAFDKQNFITKGFMAKVPGIQYKYLKERDESIQVFGGELPLVGADEHKQVLDETGIDVDGRLALLKDLISSVEPFIRQIMEYYSSIPGFCTLDRKDQISLTRNTQIEQIVTITFPLHNLEEGIISPPFCRQHPVIDTRYIGAIHGQELLHDVKSVVGKIQALELTDQEYALLSAICLMQPNACITDEGSLRCSLVQNRLRKAQEKFLSRRLDSAKVAQVMQEIKLIEIKFQKLSPKWRESWKKQVMSKFGNQLEGSSLVMQWYGGGHE